MNNLVDFFPSNYSPRQTQIGALKQIQEAIEQNYKYIICSLPTGSGKSFIPSTLCNYSRAPTKEFIKLITENWGIVDGVPNDGTSQSSFGVMALTVTKTLQDQYKDLFENGYLLKGRKNYECAVDSDFDCEMAPCLLSPKVGEDCITMGACPYLTAKKEALVSKFSVLNYSMYLSLPSNVTRRQFIVCDEASEIEDELVGFYSLKIEYDRLGIEKYTIGKLIKDTPAHALNWVCKLQDELKVEYNNCISGLSSKKKNKRLLIGDMRRAKYIKNLYERISLIREAWKHSEYVIESTDKVAEFVPIYVDNFAHNIFDNADTVILMSATISDPVIFAKSLGIEEYKYIEIDSTFDPKKSPIYCSSKYSLNYKNMDLLLPKIVDQIVQLCDKHKEEKGIIHCHNFKVTDTIQRKVRGNPRFLFRELGTNNEQILQEHSIRKDPTVLVSPSLDYGVSLDDELGRFQILAKAPYLPLGSKRIKTLFQRNEEWYGFKMITNLMQACGRCTRSETDHSVTYILDGTATAAIKRYWKKLPKHFRDRIV